MYSRKLRFEYVTGLLFFICVLSIHSLYLTAIGARDSKPTFELNNVGKDVENGDENQRYNHELRLQPFSDTKTSASASTGTNSDENDNKSVLPQRHTGNMRLLYRKYLGDDAYFNDDDNTDDRHWKKPEEENSTNRPIPKFSRMPSSQPSSGPSNKPTSKPTLFRRPTTNPSINPSISSSTAPSINPSLHPSIHLSINPSMNPTLQHTSQKSQFPSSKPTIIPSLELSVPPSDSPSNTPSLVPSLSPSSTPPTQKYTSRPTISVTTKTTTSLSMLNQEVPSNAPSSILPLERCKKSGYSFGNVSPSSSSSNITNPTTVEEPFLISYNYQVQRNKTMSNLIQSHFTDEMSQIEMSILDLLVEHFFPGCSAIYRHNINQHQNYVDDKASMNTGAYSRLLNIFAPTIQDEINEVTKRTGIIGIDTRPVDAANGYSCNDQVNDNDKEDVFCYIIEGRLAITFSDASHISDGKLQILNTIQAMMDNGKLDHCHLAIVKVRYQNDRSNANLENAVFDDDILDRFADDKDNANDFFSVMMSAKWMAVIGMSMGIVPILIFLVQQFYRKKRPSSMERQGSFHDTESSSGGDFIRPYDLSSLFESDMSYSSSSSSSSSKKFSLGSIFARTPDFALFSDDNELHQSKSEMIQMPETNEPVQRVLPTEINKEINHIVDLNPATTQRDKAKNSRRPRCACTTLNSLTHIICSLKFENLIYSRYFWCVFTVVVSTTTIVVAKLVLGLLGTVGFGLQLLVTMMLLLGIAIVVMIVFYGQVVAEVDENNRSEVSISQTNNVASPIDLLK